MSNPIESQEVVKSESKSESNPVILYCLVCKTKRQMEEANKMEYQYPSKTGKLLSRWQWKARCGTCHSNVNQFAKRD